MGAPSTLFFRFCIATFTFPKYLQIGNEGRAYVCMHFPDPASLAFSLTIVCIQYALTSRQLGGASVSRATSYHRSALLHSSTYDEDQRNRTSEGAPAMIFCSQVLRPLQKLGLPSGTAGAAFFHSHDVRM